MRADAETEQAVLAVLDAFNETLGRRDVDASVALFLSDADVTLIGSEAGESAEGPSELRAFFERTFKRPGTFRFEFGKCTVSSRGDIAWFFADATARYTEDQHVAAVPYRTTGILERREGRWLFAHYHGSEPVSQEA